MSNATTYHYLDPEALSRLKNLSLAARQVVEGYFAGLHKSPHKGFSIEFAEHREYTPGVDPRHIDWRVLGRRDKLYVKQYEEETSLRCHLLVDRSASMGYKSAGVPLTKLQYASFLAGSRCSAAMSRIVLPPGARTACAGSRVKHRRTDKSGSDRGRLRLISTGRDFAGFA